MFAPRKLLDRVLFAAIGLLLGAMVVDVTIQVVFRYVVHDPPTWTEELARYLFAWQIYLAVALAFGKGSHIMVEAVTLFTRGRVRQAIMITGNLVVLAFMLLIVWQGINMALLTSDTRSTALELNMGLVYAALPVSASISALYVVLHLVQLLRGDSSADPADQFVAVD